MPSKRRLVILAVVFSFLRDTAFGLDPAKPINQFVHDAWQIEQGLPQNSVHAILQTRDGYLWLATQEGLVRFDGVRFTVFDSSNTKAFQNNFITTLLETRSGDLWIGTSSGGLIQLRQGLFTPHNSVSSHRILSLAEDPQGGLWIGTDEGGLHHVVNGTRTTYTIREGLADNRVSALRFDADGSLWIATNGGGLQRFRDGGFASYTTASGLSSNRVWSLGRDREGSLWAGTAAGGLHRLRDGQMTSYTLPIGPPQAAVRSIVEDREGYLWLGTERGGLYRFLNGEFSAFSQNDGLSATKVMALAEDREGSLWIGTEGGGLNRLRDAPFSTYGAADGLPTDNALATYQDRTGNLWIGTSTGLARRSDAAPDSRFASYGSESGLGGQVVLTIEEDRRGDFWVGTFGAGIFRLHEGQWTRLTEREGLASNLIRVILEGSNGDLWIGTSSSGVNRLRNGVLTSFTTRNGLRSDHVWCLYEDRKRNLWVGTQGGGLSMLRGDRFITYTMAEGLGSNVVTALHEDRHGVLWIGTSGGGISRLDTDGKIQTYTTRDGLPSDVVHQILEDGDENLWVSCNKGIFRIGRRDLDEFSRGRLARIPTVSYGKADGMKSAECNGAFQPAGMRTRDGKLWFPTVKGLAVVDPARLKRNAIPPPVAIEQIVVDGTIIPLRENLQIGPGVSNLELRYTALSLVAPEKMQFRYQLEGFDAAWVEAGNRRVAYYTKVPPGRYRFRVIASNNDGIWNRAGAVSSMRVRPHFHETVWFYSLIALAAAGLLWGAFRLRLRQIQAAHAAVLAERSRMSREIHDTLSQGFTSLLLRLSAAEDVIHSDPEEARTHLRDARRLGLASLVDVRRSVMALRPQVLEGGDLPAALSALTRQTAHVTGSSVRFTVQGEARDLPPESQLNLLRLAQEALTNAVRHGQAKEMSVDLTFYAHGLTLRIADDGVGFDPSAGASSEGGGFGLTGMRERAALLGGRISWRSAPGQGTEVLLEAPL